MSGIRTKEVLLFFFILAVAACLRLSGINYGLPYGLYPDEFFSQAGNFLVFLRSISLFFGIGCIVLVYLIGSLYTRGAGLLSSAFLATSFLHIIYSKIFHPLGIVTFFLLFLTLNYVKKVGIKNNKEKHFLKFLIITILLLFVVKIVLGFLSLNSGGYSVLLVPYVAIAGGIFFSSIFSKFDNFLDWQKFGCIILFILVIWLPLKNVLNYNKLIKLPDTRKIATDWILRKTSNQYVIAWDENSLLLGKRKPSERKRYVINDKVLSKKTWFTTLRKKADYVVINSYDVEKVMRSSGNKQRKRFYKKIQSLEPEATFNPYYKDVESRMNKLLIEDLYLPFKTLWQRERFGPLIKIYKV